MKDSKNKIQNSHKTPQSDEFVTLRERPVKPRSSHSKELVTLRERPTKNGGSALQLDYSIDGVRYRESLKMYLVPERTKIDKVMNHETLKLAEAAKAKKILEIQTNSVGLPSRKAKQVLLSDYMKQRSDYYMSRGSKTYARTVLNTRQYVERYQKKTLLSQVTKEYLMGFIEFIKKQDSLGINTKNTYYTCLAIMLNSAVRDGLIRDNPSKLISAKDKPKTVDGTREFLTIDEVKQLINTPCEDQALKDSFLFSCFTGLRISDVRSLLWEEIINTGGGRLQVMKVQKKTNETVVVPLSENAKKFLPPKRHSGLVFLNMPVSPTLERRLYAWALDAKITKHLTFHVARHTFATLALTYGTDLYTVSKLLGHKSIQVTQIYAKVVDEKKRKAVDSIPDIGGI